MKNHSLSDKADIEIRSNVLNNLKIGTKLTIAFGILVALTFLVGVFSYLGSIRATVNIDRTGDVRVPTAIASSQAQADLLRMLGDVRGYLALGDKAFRDSYNQSRKAFEADLSKLEHLYPYLNPENKSRFDTLKTTFAKWAESPDILFELRDDQLDREPAYRLLATKGSTYGGTVLIGVQRLIESQAQNKASNESVELLKDMANFQGSFAAMLSGLRGYATTRNRIYRQEYEVNLTINQFAWERLLNKQAVFTPSQQAIMKEIIKNREDFLYMPKLIFEILEGDHYREDLYMFRTETLVLAETMQKLLGQMTEEQQTLLQKELNRGRKDLFVANQQTLIVGIIAIALALMMSLLLRAGIAGPILRLTQVAEQIRSGDLEAMAIVDSKDEIGILAETFNNMTDQLRQTLAQVRKEKKRADDLLDVVIPIGVELASEKDYNRLMENMLMEAKKFCNADAGILYLRSKDKHLEFVIVRNDKMNVMMGGTSNTKVTFPPIALYHKDTGKPDHQTIVTHVALTGESVNISDMKESEQFTFSGVDFKRQKPHYLKVKDPCTRYPCSGIEVFSDETYYNDTSYLAIPLKNRQNEVIGVMQLINAQDSETGQVIPFDNNLQQMMDSFSSLAVAALEAYIREQGLRNEIQQLRIEIDEVKRKKQVREIVTTDTFQDLQAKAEAMRSRRKKKVRKKDNGS